MNALTRWLATTVLASAALVGSLASPALAADPFANYRTQVTSVTPAIAGVTARAQSDGAEIIVKNTTTTPLVILGYQGEPYLRVTSAGVWENQASPATYLNKELYIDSIPKTANSDKPPQWKQVNTSSTAIWHDHRIHWMGAIQPPAVAKDPHHTHLIKTWTIGMRYGDEPVSINGTLTWIPGSRWSGYLPYGIGGGGVLGALFIGVVARRRNRSASSQTHEPPGAAGA